MDQELRWKLISSDQKLVEFDQRIESLASIFDDKNIEEELNVAIDEKTLLFIKKFLEVHEFNRDSVMVKQPLVSDKFQENIDNKSFQLFKDMIGLQHVDEVKPLLEAAYFLDLPMFKDCCFCALAVEFYIDNTDEALERFKAKNNIGDLSPEQEMSIMQEFEDVFVRLNEKLRREMQEEEEKYKQSMEQQQQSQVEDFDDY